MAALTETISYLREINIVSIVLRLTLAMVFGGLIGMERERKRRPAGFRTYMLVCMGAALTVLLGQYEMLMLNTRWASICQELGVTTDVARFGAQVISGIGFLGAGIIIVTGRQEVKGLTTTAGLWASACAGLAIGAGFYECMILSFIMIFLSITVFTRIENAILVDTRYLNIYIEFRSIEDVGTIIQQIKAKGILIFDVDLERGAYADLRRPNAVFSVQLPRRQPHTELLAALSEQESVYAIEEI
ncbi:MAG: MgtC/SapB family protein [Clostridia bacterium]|nr:MgtC/SapB family protein [Clostridia bacterium]